MLISLDIFWHDVSSSYDHAVQKRGQRNESLSKKTVAPPNKKNIRSNAKVKSETDSQIFEKLLTNVIPGAVDSANLRWECVTLRAYAIECE